MSGRAQSGCSCHGASATPAVTGTIDGIPATFEAGKAYALTVHVTGGPHAGGGFDLLVDGGTLTPGDANVKADSPTEVTHNKPSATQWKVQWTAPSSGAATFALAVNSVNLDGTENGDAWNTATFHSAGPGQEAPAQATGGSLGALWLVLAPAAAIALIAALAWFRPATPGPAPPPRAELKRALPHLALFAVALVLTAALAVPGFGANGGPGSMGPPVPTPQPKAYDLTGFSNAGASTEAGLTLDDAGPSRIQAVLTWTDEPDQSRHQNQPDTLRVTLTFGNATASAEGTNAAGGDGMATAVLDLGSTPPAGLADVNVSVECVSAGAQVGVPRGLGLRDRTDTGNAWAVVVNATYTAASASAGRSARQAPGAAEPHTSEFDPHAAVAAAGATLFAAALGSAFVLRGVLPQTLVPPRLRPTRTRHALLGSLALGILGAGAAVGVVTALAGGHAFEPHGILGLVLLAGFSAQGAAGYLALRGRPTRRLHGLIGSAMAGALLGVAVAGLVFFLA